MKVLLLIFTSCILAFYSGQGQPPIQWQKSLGGTGNENARSIVQTIDGGYIIVGTTSSNDSDVTGNHGGYDYWVVKQNILGAIQWQKSLGGTSDDVPWSIQQTNDSGFIVAGYSSSNDGDVSGNHGSNDFWIVKLDSGYSAQTVPPIPRQTVPLKLSA